MLSGGMVLFIEYLDDSLKTPEEVQYYLNTSVVGMIGEFNKPKEHLAEGEQTGVITADYPLSVATEGFRTLKTNIEFAGVDSPLKTIMVTSGNPSEGKSTIAVNLAVVMAQGGKHTILVDSDMRRPVVHRLLGIKNRKGLSDLFTPDTKLEDVIRTWGDPSIRVITSGGIPPNPPKLLSSKRMDAILDSLKQQTDFIILDTSPSIVSDPIALSAKVDGVLVVVEPGKTKIGTAQALKEQLERANANILGVVLNPISREFSYYYSKYGYYASKYYKSGYGYGYGYSIDEENE
jgi:capsular exopolysaccharide synthesis family protein